MKRSETLKLIEDLFNLELDLYPKHNPSGVFAENLLCHLEAAGMKPRGLHIRDYGSQEAVHIWEDDLPKGAEYYEEK